MENRAAQFAPFAALSGYEEILAEAARPTASKRVLSEDEKKSLSALLADIIHCIPSQEEWNFVYFLPDRLKEGGKYISMTGVVRKYDECKKTLTLFDGTILVIDNILSVTRKEQR